MTEKYTYITSQVYKEVSPVDEAISGTPIFSEATVIIYEEYYIDNGKVPMNITGIPALIIQRSSGATDIKYGSEIIKFVSQLTSKRIPGTMRGQPVSVGSRASFTPPTSTDKSGKQFAIAGSEKQVGGADRDFKERLRQYEESRAASVPIPLGAGGVRR